MKKINALVLLSGGLDSILAAKILLEQGIEVTGLIFKSYFFDEKKGVAAAKQLKIPYLVVDFSKEHLKIVKKPKYGYGTAVNPCLDCHLLMLKIANSFLTRSGNYKNIDSRFRGNSWHFVATGEVLGERPFSQNKKSLLILSKESKLNNLLVRPLFAKLLPITIPEKKGWLDRTRLFAIQGRGRHQQITLAKRFGITNYPQPAGGCILCEKVFAEKLKTMFQKWPDCSGDDIQLLKFGRHFWEGKTLIVLGRNQKENEKLEDFAERVADRVGPWSGSDPQLKSKRKSILIIPQNFPGPTALIRGEIINKITIKKAKEIILKFSPKATNKCLTFSAHSYQ